MALNFNPFDIHPMSTNTFIALFLNPLYLKKTILNVTYKSHVRPKSNGKDAYTLEYLLTQNDENLYNWSYSMSKTSKQVEQLNTQLETIRRFYEQHDVTFYNMLYDVFESCEHWNHIGRLTELKENYK